MLATTRESLCATTKTQHSQKIKIKKERKNLLKGYQKKKERKKENLQLLHGPLKEEMRKEMG